MATETGGKGGGKGYLHQLLADGARPFRFRAAVRTLLGVPDASGVQVSFSRPLPASGFAYLFPRFSGQFEFPDQLLGEHSRSSDRIEEIDFPGHWLDVEGGDPGPAHPGTRTTASQSPQMGDAQAKPAHAVGKPAQLGPQAGAGDGATLLPSDASILPASDLPSASARRLPMHEVVVPDGRQLPAALRTAQRGAHAASAPPVENHFVKSADSLAAIPESGVRPVQSPIAGEPPPPLGMSSLSGPPRPTAAGEREGLDAPAGSLAPSRSVASVETRIPGSLNIPPPRSGTPWAAQHPTAGRAADDASSGAAGNAARSSRIDFSPLPAQNPSAPLPARPAQTVANVAATRPRRSLSAEPAPGEAYASRAHDPFEHHHQSAAGAPGQTSAPPPATPPVLLVHPALGPDMAASTPAAFWERRHLTHLTLRMRR